ncbi:class I SAM-dependent methyltransferase [Salegentibacter sp. F63223]|nr:class I SAM-dependent methyltransferase [Salegentibacter maritimus]
MHLKSYIKFLLKSQNQHGLHSPFVYDLVTKCFYDRKKYEAYTLLNDYRKNLLKNNKTIQVTDFGAGSRVFTSNERSIASIAKNVGIPKKRARFLFRLVNYLNCKNILELGTSLGIGTAALSANKNSKVTSIEGCPQTANVARVQLNKFGLSNVDLKVGEFEEILSKFVVFSNKATNNKQQTHYDLIYFDGHHTKEATLNYFQQLLPTAHNDSVFIFDDIHWSPGMEAAWEEIKAHPRVKVSIDTFFLGLIFFRKEQAKQHFTIRL